MICSRCGKRPAVVFVTNNNSKESPTVGYCLTCAKELKIKPVEDLISKMGISDEDLENVQDQMNSLMQGGDINTLMEQLGGSNLAEQMENFAAEAPAAVRMATSRTSRAANSPRRKRRRESTSISIART